MSGTLTINRKVALRFGFRTLEPVKPSPWKLGEKQSIRTRYANRNAEKFPGRQNTQPRSPPFKLKSYKDVFYVNILTDMFCLVEILRNKDNECDCLNPATCFFGKISDNFFFSFFFLLLQGSAKMTKFIIRLEENKDKKVITGFFYVILCSSTHPL